MNLLDADNTTNGNHFCILDFSNPEDVDYKFLELKYMEKYKFPAATLKIGKYKIIVPLNWYIVVADEGEMELLPIRILNGRDFNAFVFNPLSDPMPRYLPITMEHIDMDYQWLTPKLKRSVILCAAMEKRDKPACCFIVDKMMGFSSIDISDFV